MEQATQLDFSDGCLDEVIGSMSAREKNLLSFMGI
jgi:hypothetical protein